MSDICKIVFRKPANACVLFCKSFMNYSLAKKCNLYCISAILSTVLLLFITRPSYQSGDSLSYACAARTGDVEMFHPHHLLFSPFIRVLHRVFSIIIPDMSLLTTGQIHNTIWALISIVSLFNILLRVPELKAEAALWVSTLFAVTYGLMTYSSWFEVYVPALGSIAFLVAVLASATETSLGLKRYFVITLLLTLSILYHQTNILFIIPMILYFSLSNTRRISELIPILSVTGALVLGSYVLAYTQYSHQFTISGLFRYTLNYVYHPNSSWGSLANISIRGLGNLAYSQSQNIVNVPCAIWVYIIAPLTLLTVAILLAQNLIQVLKRNSTSSFRVLLTSWIVVYYGFFLWWLPGEQEFFLITLFPLIILIVLSLYSLYSSRYSYVNAWLLRAVMTLLVAALLFFNRILPMLEGSHNCKGEAYSDAAAINGVLSNLESPNDVLILTDFEIQQNLRYYFNHEFSVGVLNPLLCCYQHIPIREKDSIANESIILVDARYIMPGYRVGEYCGYSHPIEWFAFISYLFNMSYDNLGDVAYCRDFSVVCYSSVQRFIILSRSRLAVDGIQGFVHTLDERGCSENALPFSDWMGSADSLFP